MGHTQGTINETNSSFLGRSWVSSHSVKFPSHHLPSALETGVNIYKQSTSAP
jgi:hypothetical protein